MVASAHPLASLAGLDVLRAGGNAFDTAVAVNAVLNVTQPHMCGIGGDAFYLLYPAKSGEVKFLNASGCSSEAVDRNYFIENGYTRIPLEGYKSVLTVPGCVDGWEQVFKKYGTLELDYLLKPAIEYAENGFPISRGLSSWIAKDIEALSCFPESAKTFLKSGKPPKPGEILVQPDLAKTLKAIAAGSRKAFYEGEIAEKIVGDLRKNGGFLTEQDFERHHSTWGEPLKTNYRGYTVYQTPPNTQGMALLMALNIMEGYDVASMGHNSVSLLHHMCEIKKIVFQLRNHYISDPDFTEIPVNYLLSRELAEKLRGFIDPDRASILSSQISLPGDTTFFAVADGDGNIVSCIQSIYFSFGSKVMPKDTGILLHNRGACFSLDEGDVNVLEPYKRPLHTLIASIIFRKTQPFMAFGTMGGDGQVQTHMAVVSGVLDFGMNIQQAIEAPRWLHGGTRVGEKNDKLNLEKGIPLETAEGLKKLGHEVDFYPRWASKMGHAQGILIDSGNGVFYGGADPRGDGYALGW